MTFSSYSKMPRTSVALLPEMRQTPWAYVLLGILTRSGGCPGALRPTSRRHRRRPEAPRRARRCPRSRLHDPHRPRAANCPPWSIRRSALRRSSDRPERPSVREQYESAASAATRKSIFSIRSPRSDSPHRRTLHPPGATILTCSGWRSRHNNPEYECVSPDPAVETVVMKFGGSSVAIGTRSNTSRNRLVEAPHVSASSRLCPRWATRPTASSSSRTRSRRIHTRASSTCSCPPARADRMRARRDGRARPRVRGGLAHGLASGNHHS